MAEKHLTLATNTSVVTCFLNHYVKKERPYFDGYKCFTQDLKYKVIYLKIFTSLI